MIIKLNFSTINKFYIYIIFFFLVNYKTIKQIIVTFYYKALKTIKTKKEKFLNNKV